MKYYSIRHYDRVQRRKAGEQLNKSLSIALLAITILFMAYALATY